MCGEHKTQAKADLTGKGSSPHVRGAHQEYDGGQGVGGIIPACAGSTLLYVQHVVKLRDHPRMCGEHPIAFATPEPTVGSSPHVRGARRRRP